MPEKKAGVGTKIDEWRADPEAFAEALNFTGDRLMCLLGPDGFTRIDEKKRTEKGGYRLLTRRHIPTDEARRIAEDFQDRGGSVVWK